MLLSGPSGFQNSPVTKALMLLVTGLSLLAASSHKRFDLDLAALLTRKQLWRLISCHFMFTTPGELLFGLLLLYSFRQFERLMGSRKFASKLLCAAVVSTALQLGFLSYFPELGSIVPGPYSFVFGLLVYFFLDIPVSLRFRFFGVSLSDKSFSYLLGLQLLLMQYPTSAISGVCGLLGGIASRSELPPFRWIRWPALVSRAAARVLGPLLSSRPRTAAPPSDHSHAAAMQDPTVPLVQDPHSHGYQDQLIPSFGTPWRSRGAAMAPPASPPTPREDLVLTLTEMGFSRTDAEHALVRTNNNLQHATNLLLSAS